MHDILSKRSYDESSRFKTRLYISYHGGNAVRYIKQRGYFMIDFFMFLLFGFSSLLLFFSYFCYWGRIRGLEALD